MNIYLLFALSFIPLLTVFLLFRILVPGQKIRYELWACFVGLLTLIPASFVQYYILNLPIFLANTVINLLITAIIFNGFIEEAFKAGFMFLLPQKKLTLPVFFTCALLCGMTLGCFESVVYMIKKINAAIYPLGATALLTLMVKRMFTAVLIHTFCAGLSGLGLWMLRHKQRHLSPFIWAILLHGLYNYFADFKDYFYWFSTVAILKSIQECYDWYKYNNLSDTGVDIKRK